MAEPPPPPSYNQATGYPAQAGGYPTHSAYAPQGGYPPAPAPGSYQQPQQGYYPPGPPVGADGGHPPQQPGYKSGNPKPTEAVPEEGYAQPLNTTTDWESTGDGNWAGGSFSDKAIRRAFIRKVYLILMCQLLFTVGVISFFKFHLPTQRWIRTEGRWCYWVSYGTFLVTYITLVCCPSVRRKWPVNFICLAVFTAAFSYMAGTISSYYDTDIVLISMGITAAVCLSITCFAIQTKIDFTMCSGLLFAMMMVLVMFGFAVLITSLLGGPSRILYCVYGGLGALVFSMFLIYDTQMLMGGRKYSMSPEEHIFGALQLYLDIVYIFIFLLTLFGSSSN